MAYDTQDCWVFYLVHHLVFWNTRCFRDSMYPPSDKWERSIYSAWFLKERDSLNHCTSCQYNYTPTVGLSWHNMKHLLWLSYVDNTFVVWAHSPDRLWNFFNLIKGLRSSTEFTMEIESDSPYLFLDFLVISKGSALVIKVCGKPNLSGCCLNFQSNHPLQVKSGIIQSSHNTMCQEGQDLFIETDNLWCDLKFGCYFHWFIISVLHSKGRSSP
jgi:hypothetical protein